jgi:type II secretory ATPase GspE/PulE/Tfp pilus assembly ATPase PilB-like protein
LFDFFQDKIDLEASAGEDCIPDMVKNLLDQASSISATDLHVECRRNGAVIKVRVDGVLYPVGLVPGELMQNVIARLKVLARAKTFDRRAPQDGRIEFSNNTGKTFLRAAFLPTLHGEKAVIRFPDRSKISFELEDLGLRPEDLLRLEDFLNSQQGTLLLTGPISSGKTTTIYSILKRLIQEKKEGLSISSIEDPIEAEIPGISQSQIDIKGGLTYATGLRMLLRQDTDVLMVGEIRDEETAAMAIRAGLIGHLVISTIHSPDAAGVFTRLLNMGLEPFLLASSIGAVVSQRLLRKLCVSCREKRKAGSEEKKMLKSFDTDEIHIPKGCEKCINTGYRGRTGIFEFLYMNEEIRELVMQKMPTLYIRKKARETKMQPLINHAAEKVISGETSMEEFARVIQ